MERAYTVKEIDDLRNKVEDRMTYGTSNRSKVPPHRIWQCPDRIHVEQVVRTYMLAGITANDIRAEDEKRNP